MDTKDFLNLTYEEKLAVMVEDPASLHLPDEAAYVAQYLSLYEPVNPPVDGYDNATSYEIADELNAICDIELNVVGRIMRMLGYRLYVEEGEFIRWSMKLK